MRNFDTMTNAQINERIRELTAILDGYAEGDWSEAYSEYNKLRAVQDERYRVENQTAFDAFYEKHIKGKTWEEIDQAAWDFYSDWHKDMYGFRPKSI